ncbi:hypothetical protein Angca_007707, partial [Angiostrongylus cantonensis]
SKMIFFAVLLTQGFAMEFTPYQSAEQYKCGAFLQRRIDDKTLSYFYSSINNFVSLLSTAFPHEELLNRQALTGDLNEIRKSIETKYLDWWSWQKGWLIAVCSLVSIGIVFPIFYLFYRCCVCCWSSPSRKQNTDSRYDGCKRNFLNVVMMLLIFFDVFAAATLLITGQYAEYGMEELPSRLNYCIDDLNLYKRDTDSRIRKLLIDDYQMLNRTLLTRLSDAGLEVIQRVKKLTGANTIDKLINISRSAEDIQNWIDDIRTEIWKIVDDYSQFEVEFGRMRHTLISELQLCLHNEIESVKAVCHKAEKSLEAMTPPRLKVDLGVISLNADEALQQIRRINVPQLLDSAVQHFTDMQNKLQIEINKKVHSSQTILKRIADDLFVTAETISIQIRQINFDVLYDLVAHATDPKWSVTANIMHYSRPFLLVVTSIFMLIAFCFLFGLFYGVCGRRPTFYNDDCCVRSTGGRFYSCGIWLAMATFTALSILTASLLFTVGNASDIACQTFRDPLSRPDVLSLVQRYIEIVRSRWHSSDGGDLLSLIGDLSVVDLIRGCQRNETLYEVFELDRKFQLKKLKSLESEAYMKLERFLNVTFTDLPTVEPFNFIISKEHFELLQQLSSVNVSEIDHIALSKINSTVSNMDIEAKAKVFESKLDEVFGRPKAVSSMLEQVDEIGTRRARPLRLKLSALFANLTKLNKRQLRKMQVPISSLIAKLQHSQALLSENLQGNVEKAAREQLVGIFDNINQYIDHVKFEVQHDVSSCAPIAAIVSSSASALCDHTVDPLNGVWMSMLISLLCITGMLTFSTSLVRLYSNMHSYPKFVLEMPQNQHLVSSFITDTYETRHKPFYTNYSCMDNYQRTLR